MIFSINSMSLLSLLKALSTSLITGVNSFLIGIDMPVFFFNDPMLLIPMYNSFKGITIYLYSWNTNISNEINKAVNSPKAIIIIRFAFFLWRFIRPWVISSLYCSNCSSCLLIYIRASAVCLSACLLPMISRTA
ncbi:hypothetical protein SDC9_132460 [bioreactor metagenome]|uniref:Uncharacterized protein n=1 Tax=bioreactor metagenome TaxID=1076179 RepID=A0A645D781_9ZZZZ